MRIKRIIVENQVKDSSYVKNILDKMKHREIVFIDNYTDWFGRYHKPYLDKRNNLQLFLARKQGKTVKPAPEAYGVSGEPHYYFVHAYNCIYECEYCYLQGYFRSPDLVLFTNHDEIRDSMTEIARSFNSNVWFHAGEFSDSLALSHITEEWAEYSNWLQQHPNAKIELRTKSANLRGLKNVNPHENLIISYSIAPEDQVSRYDHSASALDARLRALQKLYQRGFKLGLHCDPVIYNPKVFENYRNLFLKIKHFLPLETIEYLSIGMVRFAKDTFSALNQNYPQSALLAEEFVTGSDGKKRYARHIRLRTLNKLKEIAIESGFRSESVYICMEEDSLQTGTPALLQQ
ncbi:MAG: hypothetical protein KDK38_04105 [Leptospiraceae bacterium]|nr:hypothetical protein [Leptospiraceae bacterium]